MGSVGPRFRRARPEEAELLGAMTIKGISHWGHDVNFPELVEDLKQNDLPTPAYVEGSPVFVLEQDGDVIGFYGLRQHDDFVDLVYMFLELGAIGNGYGRVLWEHAVTQAASLSSRMRILSDPGATGFYAAMGAELERDHEVAPGFLLGVFWYDLPT